jgi:FKBP-type peptidyl-prolyl cis-trans isomerase SlyD
LSWLTLCDHRSMIIAAPCVVSLTWNLSDGQGQAIDQLVEAIEFFVGGDDLLPAIEAALLGQCEGFEADLYLEPDQAFGDYDASLVCVEDRANLPEPIELGMQFEGLPEGSLTRDVPADAIFTVTELYPSHVVLDGNHPLAGMALRLSLKVLEVREATEDEIDSRSVDGGPVTVLAANMPPPLH